MPETSPILSLPLLQPAQAQKHVTCNEALMMLDALVQLAVQDRDRVSPPDAPLAGQRHIVAGSGAGAWAGQGGAVALFDGTAWRFISPAAGWRARVLGEDCDVVHDSMAWSVVALHDLPLLGINATADGTNRLVVAATASLFSHDGAGHRLTVNKAGAGDTASLLFQSDWSGRAEIGLAGSDAWSLKVSAEGTVWTEALTADPATGHLTGAAVQSSASDVTEGRLMRADYGYSRGNLVGSVSESAGVPDGAALERGATGKGEYLRLADGTQMCWHAIDLIWDATNTVTATWTFPRPFTTMPVLSLAAPDGSSSYEDCDATEFGLFQQGGNEITASLVLTGQATLAATAKVKACRVMAVGRWF